MLKLSRWQTAAVYQHAGELQANPGLVGFEIFFFFFRSPQTYLRPAVEQLHSYKKEVVKLFAAVDVSDTSDCAEFYNWKNAGLLEGMKNLWGSHASKDGLHLMMPRAWALAHFCAALSLASEDIRNVDHGWLAALPAADSPELRCVYWGLVQHANACGERVLGK